MKSELKSWSSVLKNSCSKAPAPKKIKAALKRASEEEDRSQNLVIYGLPEKNDEILEKRVLEVLENIDEKPRIVSCCRMGKTVSDGGPAIKPIKFTLSGSDHVRQVLSKAIEIEIEIEKLIYSRHTFDNITLHYNKSKIVIIDYSYIIEVLFFSIFRT